jgi:uncharacterized protein YueI
VTIVTEDNVQQRLENGIYGKPQLKADETNKFLGNYRERIYLAMTTLEMKDEKNLEAFGNFLNDEIGADLSIVINNELPLAIQSSYMKVAKEKNIPLKLYTREGLTAENDDIGLVAYASTAVNVENISITRYHINSEDVNKENSADTDSFKKMGFFARLFKKNGK